MLVIIFMSLPNLDGIGRYQNKWMDRWMEQKGKKEAREERKSFCSCIGLETYF